jgi:hypothetical protein
VILNDVAEASAWMKVFWERRYTYILLEQLRTWHVMVRFIVYTLEKLLNVFKRKKYVSKLTLHQLVLSTDRECAVTLAEHGHSETASMENLRAVEFG